MSVTDGLGMRADEAMHCRMYDKWIADQSRHLTKTKKRTRRGKSRPGRRHHTPPFHPCDESDVDDETLERMADFVLEESKQPEWVVIADVMAPPPPKPSSWWRWLLS